MAPPNQQSKNLLGQSVGLALCVGGLLLAPPAAAAPQYGGSRPPLTQGLDDLLGPPPAQQPDAPKPDAPQRAAKPQGPARKPDLEMLNELIEEGLQGGPRAPIVGEDIGREKQDPLVRVQQNMGHASQLVERIDDSAKQVQQQIVTDLDELIAKLEKQCQGGQSDKPQQQDQQSRRSQPKQAQSKQGDKPQDKPGKPQPSQSQAANAAGDSTMRLGSSEGAAVEGRRGEALMKQVWGHLPQRVREQMLQGSSDEFLPQYREEIELYFQRLAEEEAGR